MAIHKEMFEAGKKVADKLHEFQKENGAILREFNDIQINENLVSEGDRLDTLEALAKYEKELYQ